MKKLILYASLICIGMASCSKDYVVDEESMPGWLGESIYGELKSPKSLNGTFNTYLRLIDDLGYTEVLGHTGSKTIFPANDEAFAEYFKDGNNRYGARSYDDLTKSQKAQLLFSSMIDNAILIGNISTEQNANGDLLQGRAVKHSTNLQLVNTIEPLYSQNFPKNNPFFDRFVEAGSLQGIYDNTVPPMVHFTGEYMLNNSMTVVGDDNDFSVITGNNYNDGDAYVFKNKVIAGNVTCQNGYIHQLNGVLEPPGNMAQVLREDTESGSGTSLFSRMLDYFCAPFNDVATKNLYDAWAIENGEPTIGNVYAIRYFSQLSRNAVKLDRYTDDDGKTSNVHTESQLLNFDPGWNQYKPSATSSQNEDIAAILAPTDDAIWEYFKENGGGGAYIIENLGNPALENTRENLGENFDAVYNNDPTVFTNMLNNLMKAYFSKTVPSKFSTVQNDAFEFMGVTLDDVHKNASGKYDVKIANNGVIYKMDKFFAPQLYNSVLGPASVYQNMRTMGQMLNDHAVTAGEVPALGVNMYYYLMSMKSKYAVFVPEDNSTFIYIDPTSIYDADNYGTKALRFRFNSDATDAKFNVMVQKGVYENGVFQELGEYTEENIENGTYSTQIQDMLNYHVVVLNSSEDGLSGNHFYKTKHGGAIYVPDGFARNGKTVLGGAQVEGNAPAAKVITQYSKTGRQDADPEANIENGTCYLIDAPIQPTTRSTYKVLSEKYQKFYEFMNGFEGNTDILTFAGISNVINEKTKKSEQTNYTMFEATNNNSLRPDLYDARMRMLGAYNYTVYAPTDDAMEQAYAKGLPSWDEIENLYKIYSELSEGSSEYAAAQKEIRTKIDVMRQFVFYHIQNNSVFADNTISSGSYQTFCTDDLGIAQPLNISGGNGTLNVRDIAGQSISVVYGSENANILARDIVTTSTNKGKAIDYSSFVTIHGIDTPLCFNRNGRYDGKWSGASAAKRR